MARGLLSPRAMAWRSLWLRSARAALAVLALGGLAAGCDPDSAQLYTSRTGRGRSPGVSADGGRTLPAPPEPGEKVVPDGGPPPGPVPSRDAGTTPPAQDAGARDAATAASDEAYCVELINQYRAMLGKPPYTLSMELQSSATQAAMADSQSGIPHGNFSFGGGGGASAENEIPGWPNEGGVREVIRGGLQMMWEEGPGGGHYENMAGDYREAGCGIAITRGNEVWSAQRFR